LTTLTSEQREVFGQLINDPDELKYVRAFMRIPNKQRLEVPFDPWPVQAKLIHAMSGRDIVVKDSQCGSTSIFTGVYTKRTITIPNTTSVIMAHDEFTTGRLLHRAQILYDSIPAQAKPVQDHSSTYEKRFPDINSVMYISTARAAVAGRGEPIHNLLLSEAAFYQQGTRERIIIPALQRVPPDGSVVIESTPNGEDELFYEEVQKCLNGQSTFKLHVVYWWDNPDNFLSADSPAVHPDDRGDLEYTSEEMVFIINYGCTEGNIRWRRWKIREAGELFFQEHLEDLNTCFLVTGASFYPTEPLLRLHDGCYPAPHIGPAESAVWFPPEERGIYVMGIDPGQGKLTETVCSVWRWFPPPIGDDPARGPRLEARLSGIFEAAENWPPIQELANWYNHALIDPEANGHGQGLVREARNYPNLYWREDIVSGQKTMVIGWLSTPKTKPYMMQTIKRYLPTLECYDIVLVKQLRGFRDLGEGKYLKTTMDDHHDAAGLALVALPDAGHAHQRGFRGSSGYTNWDG
jgi:hypothetical protein